MCTLYSNRLFGCVLYRPKERGEGPLVMAGLYTVPCRASTSAQMFLVSGCRRTNTHTHTTNLLTRQLTLLITRVCCVQLCCARVSAPKHTNCSTRVRTNRLCTHNTHISTHVTHVFEVVLSNCVVQSEYYLRAFHAARGLERLNPPPPPILKSC